MAGIQSGQSTSAVPNTGAAMPGMTAMPLGTSNIPSTVQRVNGGFGISPQLLQMISQLQSRQPTGQAFNVAQFQPKPFTPMQSPYGQTQWGQAPFGGTQGR